MTTVGDSPVSADNPGASPAASADGIRRVVAVRVTAVAVFVASAVFYGLCLFPGLGGELNAGDSAKFQILGHTSILVHGPGYPLVLLIGFILRGLALPFSEWWTLTFVLSAVPAAVANMMGFLIVHRITRSVPTGIAGALILGTAGLMTVQATEAEVYALNIAFVLTTVYLLGVFVETKRLGYFIAACAVYAVSFGNHLMMIMLLPVFLFIAAVHYRIALRPKPIAIVIGFVLLGASQYLFLAYVTHRPDTAYSEYMPLPPEPMELVHYIMGTYFGDLYGAGLSSERTLEAIYGTVKSAHPWVSLPLAALGLILFLAAWMRREPGWRALAVVYGGALAFTPFVLWYGAFDIEAFHLPVLALSLAGSVAAVGLWARRIPPASYVVAGLLLAVGLVRVGQVSVYLGDREPPFEGLPAAVSELVAQAPGERPVFAMPYDLRMATLYHELRGEVPATPVYRVRWRAVAAIGDAGTVGGIVVPTDGRQFVRWIEHHRPDLYCATTEVEYAQAARWPAYSFECWKAPPKLSRDRLPDGFGRLHAMR